MAICEKCNNEIILKPRTIRDRKRLGLPNLCKTCIKSNASKVVWDNMSPDKKEQLMNKAYQGRYEHFKNLTKEGWKAQSDAISKGLKAMTESSKIIRSRKLSISHKKYWNNITEEEYLKRCEQMKYGWQNMDINKREELLNNMRERSTNEEYRKNMSIIKKKYFADNPNAVKKLSEYALEWWKTESEMKKARQSNTMKSWWNSLTPNEKSEWNLKRSTNQGAANNGPKSTELEFINRLNLLSISYEYQYSNKIIHPEFNEIFKQNPITGGKIHPYHKWDFIIHTRMRNIFIDIDGSMHTIQTGDFIADGIDIGAYIQFNDAQRPYQTDGLDAYVILSYNDKLEDETSVLSINTGKMINLSSLLSIIAFDNMSNKEIKKMIKNKK